ncbi:hypothetical protein [Lacinutrix sp. Hel_I_90]|uniref:hypothetical protein n=1 Tax=Lacinutrix sp. Hel_I_90 TaxID=1249999 RepID=UPI0012E0011B|nr:hypothetical protein [Lacinutrix sp. Hel_I_90]
MSVQVPDNLIEMSEEMFQYKYGMNQKPSFVVSNEDGTVNFIANLSNMSLAENNLIEYRTRHLSKLMKSRSDIEVSEVGEKDVNGKQIVYFKFLTQAIDQKIFNYYFFTVYKGKLLMFTFNTIEVLKEEWEKKADNILLSIKIK